MALTDKLTAIANAIRGKTGKTDALTLDQMPGEITGIQAGGGDIMLGSYKLIYGQVTPTETGSFWVDLGFKCNIQFATVWLADQSVIKEKYSSLNIMVESHSDFAGDENKEIHYATKGTTSSVVKTAFGLRRYGIGSLYYESHANWPAQPETYNWIALVSEV